MVRLFALVLCLAAASAGGTGKAPDPSKSIRWARSWAAAVEEARALNLPLVVHRHGFY